MEFILGILFLLVLDIVLSVDNAILIASTTKDLEGDQKKWAQIIGASGAVLLRLIFVVILMFAFTVLEGVILVYILGGAVLIYIGISITIEKKEHEGSKAATNIGKAVMLIMAGDIMMSFDNALIISEVSIEIASNFWVRLLIIAIALGLSLIIIIFFSSQLAKFMKENPWLIYVAAALLLGVGIEMIIKDPLFGVQLASHWILLISYSLGALIIGCKYYFLDRKSKNETDDNDNTGIVKGEAEEKDAN